MYSYVEACAVIQRMLRGFLERGIDVTKLDTMNRVIKSSEIDQVKILNSYLSLLEQRALFGATRNIHTIIKVMKEKLKIARETHENPTTIELSLEIMQHLSNVASYIDEFMIRGKAVDINRLNELSRILYKKASYFGFYQDVETQLKDARISEEEVKTFVEKLNENMELEVESEDESLQ
jgi:hypothetical protein